MNKMDLFLSADRIGGYMRKNVFHSKNSVPETKILITGILINTCKDMHHKTIRSKTLEWSISLFLVETVSFLCHQQNIWI